MIMKENLLEVRGLSLEFRQDDKVTAALKSVSFDVGCKEIFGLVGESGCGKTVTALSLTRILPKSAVITNGSIKLEGQDILKMPKRELVDIRGAKISYVFQEPVASLNPVLTIGDQIAETIALHQKKNKRQARQDTYEIIQLVKLENPKQVFEAYPHQLSGGMNQRAMIAMAISCNPKLLVADEPTTALDVIVQEEILELLKGLQSSLGLSILFITHDLSLITRFADRIAIMKDGRIVESGTPDNIARLPQHEYSKKLMSTINELKQQRPERGRGARPLLEVENVKKSFVVTGGFFKRATGAVAAVDGISFGLSEARTLAIVGESGSGKTTLAKVTLDLIGADSGKVIFSGKDLFRLRGRELRSVRKEIGFVQQDPYSSLNPRMSILEIVSEPLIVHGLTRGRKAAADKAEEALKMVGLDPSGMRRYPHQFSGGQRQRICIARAIVPGPKIVICDEPVSSLDIFTQAQILRLLRELQEKFQLSYMFISHDLRVVKYISDEVLVMRRGKAVEYSSARELFSNPRHEYTKKLLRAAGF